MYPKLKYQAIQSSITKEENGIDCMHVHSHLHKMKRGLIKYGNSREQNSHKLRPGKGKIETKDER